jgi:transketolase C-terminal domain/subunit
VLHLVENHSTVGGQASALLAELASLPPDVRRPVIVRHGIDRIPDCGWNREVLQAHGLDRTALAGAFERSARAG